MVMAMWFWLWVVRAVVRLSKFVVFIIRRVFNLERVRTEDVIF